MTVAEALLEFQQFGNLRVSRQDSACFSADLPVNLSAMFRAGSDTGLSSVPTDRVPFRTTPVSIAINYILPRVSSEGTPRIRQFHSPAKAALDAPEKRGLVKS